MKILDEYEALEDKAARGALLRREGLYSSNITGWRRQRDRGGDDALAKTAGRQKSPTPSTNKVFPKTSSPCIRTGDRP